jgi:hypothetical protein
MKGELNYRAVVAVGVDLETGEVESVTVRSATVDDERVDVSISLDSEEEQRDDAFDRAQQIVDAGAPFELRGWWAPSPDQRWPQVAEESGDDQLMRRWRILAVACSDRRRRRSAHSRRTRSRTRMRFPSRIARR